MKKIILLALTFFIMLDAKESREALFNNLSHSDDEQTLATIKQYAEASFNVSAYNSNYFLPISYRVDNNYANTQNSKYPPNQLESEFQISIKYDIDSNLLGFDEIYTAAYTQRSFWQTYTESAYFRETNYNPEIFVNFPIRISKDSSGIRAIKFGFAHMSNGRGGDMERSWNNFYTDLYFQLGFVFVDLKLWSRLNDYFDYNPDIIDYLGHGHLRFIIPYKKNLIQTIFRYSQKGHAASELNYSYPIFNRDDIFLYFKAFEGYGESLIDYNHRVDKIGLGLSISR